jgi:hypothetical protein
LLRPLIGALGGLECHGSHDDCNDLSASPSAGKAPILPAAS